LWPLELKLGLDASTFLKRRCTISLGEVDKFKSEILRSLKEYSVVIALILGIELRARGDSDLMPTSPLRKLIDLGPRTGAERQVLQRARGFSRDSG